MREQGVLHGPIRRQNCEPGLYDTALCRGFDGQVKYRRGDALEENNHAYRGRFQFGSECSPFLTRRMTVRYDADMIEHITALLTDEYKVDATGLEFSAGYGIADVVGVKYEQLDVNLSPRAMITDQRELHVLLSMPVGKAVSAASVSAKVGLSAAYTQKFLRALDEKDYVERQESKFLRVLEIMIEAEVVVSVEAKLKKWRQALGQAKRYQHFSNIVFVALPQAVVHNIDRNLFRRENIGVIQVSEDSAEVLIKPQRITPKNQVMHQYCCQSLFAGSLGAFAGASV